MSHKLMLVKKKEKEKFYKLFTRSAIFSGKEFSSRYNIAHEHAYAICSIGEKKNTKEIASEYGWVIEKKEGTYSLK